jgi:hypothetical protein
LTGVVNYPTGAPEGLIRRPNHGMKAALSRWTRSADSGNPGPWRSGKACG